MCKTIISVMFYIPHYPTYEKLPFLLCLAPPLSQYENHHFVIFYIMHYPIYGKLSFLLWLAPHMTPIWKIIIFVMFYIVHYPTYEKSSFLLSFILKWFYTPYKRDTIVLYLWFAPHIAPHMKKCSFIMLHIPYYLFIFDIRGGIWRLVKAFSESLRKLKNSNRKWSYCLFYTRFIQKFYVFLSSTTVF